MSRSHSEPFKASAYLHPRHWLIWMTLGFLRLAVLLPYPWIVRLGRQMGNMFYRLTPKDRRKVVGINLKLCFPEKDLKARAQLERECYHNIGISLMEMGMGWWWPEHKLRKLVELRGMEHLEQALQQGKGAILLTGHYTSLELGARLMALFTPMQVMYRTQSSALFDSFLFTKRDAVFEQTVSRKNTRKLLRGLKQGLTTWYAPDQDFSFEKNIFAPFMGIPAATISASVRLIKLGNAPVLPYYVHRKTDGSGYLLEIAPIQEDFPLDDDIAGATRINALIEAGIRRYPDQYLWIHKRFKSRPDGEANPYLDH